MITKESIDGEDFFAVDEPPNQGATNVYSSHFSADTFVAPRHDGMTVEVSTSDRHTNSKPSPHITPKSILMCNNR